MKIAVISDVVYPWVKGGSEMRYHEIYSKLAQEHEVHFFTMQYPDMPSEDFEFQGMQMHCVCNAPESLYSGKRRRILPAFIFTLALIPALFRYLFDVVDSNQSPYLSTLVLAIYKLLRPTALIVATWHEYWTLRYWKEYAGPITGLIGYTIQHLALNIPHLIITVSHEMKRKIEWARGGSHETVLVIPNGVNRERIERIRRETSTRPYTLVFVGRLIPEKKVDKFIALVKKLENIEPKISATVVGDGPRRQYLKRLAGDADIRFTGFIPSHDEVLKEIASSAVFVSFSEREGFNIAALEAAQLGLPTFVSLDLFDHNNLHTIDKGFVNSIIAKLRTSEKEKQTIDPRYTWESVAKQIENTFLKSMNRQ